MNNDVPTEIITELLSLKRKLQTISDISFAFSNLNRQSPLTNLTTPAAIKLIEDYKNLIEEAKKIVS